jgi:hypothetical protein
VLTVAVDTAGNVYAADYHRERVLKISPAGAITTFAGSGVRGFSGDGGRSTYGYSGDGGPAASANIGYPYHLASGQTATSTWPIPRTPFGFCNRSARPFPSAPSPTEQASFPGQ